MEKKKLFSCCAAGVVVVYAASLLLFGRLKDDGLEDKSVQGSMEPGSMELDSMEIVLDGWAQGRDGIEVYNDQGGAPSGKGQPVGWFFSH